jgi:carboxypeptidase Taq
METKFEELKKHLARIEDIEGALRLMSWDQQTYMPPGAAQTRADQIATLTGISHELKTDETFGQLLEELNSSSDELDYDSDEASIIRFNWREYQRLVKIPAEKMETFTSASAIAYEVWKEARQNNDFSLFQPHLEKLLDMQLELTEFLNGDSKNPYDLLLAFYEPGMTAERISAIFDPIRPQLVELIKNIQNSYQVDDSFLFFDITQDDLLALSQSMSERLGYSFEYGRLDLTTHPFTSGNSYRDARITTRIERRNPMATLLASIHEAGHAIHRQQSSPALYRTLTSQYTMGIGESQSRSYEMIIGRSREFWSFFFPRMQETVPALQDIPLENFYRAVNKVESGFIRVEADPVTYGLHIMLRFELENSMLNGEIQAKDLPGLWNAKMEDYLGLVPPNDSVGVLQDVHWTSAMGYFPSYLLGSIFAVQLWYKILEDYPNYQDNMANGHFSPITRWLGNRIHKHGGKFTLPEIAERATGEPLTSQPFMEYLKKKFGEIYRF